MAILDSNQEKLLLAKRPFEDGWRFIGGFSHPNDVSFEQTAKRKIREDVGINLVVSELKYIGSTVIPDWRYQSEEDKIITTLYKTVKGWGSIEPSDDVSELMWVDISELDKITIVKEHKILLEMFLENIKK